MRRRGWSAGLVLYLLAVTPDSVDTSTANSCAALKGGQ
jgi:hypothetical protein